MRRLSMAAVAAIALWACRPYDNYSSIARQDGLIPAAQFARFGKEQATVVAIGRALAAWKMTADAEGYEEQASRAACFARRFPEVAAVDTDPLGHRLTVRFKSGWRVGVVPVEDGVAPEATPGISAPGPGSCL